MDKNSILAILLILLVLFAFQYYNLKQAQQRVAYETAQRTQPFDANRTFQADQIRQVADKEPEVVGRIDQNITAPSIPEEQLQATERYITVQTPLYRALISTKGARMVSFRLLKHLDELGGDPIEMFSKRPVEDEPDSFDIKLASTSLSRQINKGIYIPQDSMGDKVSVPKGGKVTINLIRITEDGFKITREYTFNGTSYDIITGIKIENYTNSKLRDLPGLVLGNSFAPDLGQNEGGMMGRYGGRFGFLVGVGNKAKKVDFTKAGIAPPYRGHLGWAAYEASYFIGGIILNPSREQYVTFHKIDDEHSYLEVQLPEVSISPTESYRVKAKVYIGPKDLDHLKLVGSNFNKVVDYGIFGFIAHPLFIMLQFFYRYTHNWGWAIIIITIVIKLVLYLPTQKQMQSMKKMQALNPQIQDLRRKYKKDPVKLNKELTELYKKYNVNPMGGCLPILIQLPIFIALYNVLLVSIELRHAPFIFWLKDLSAKDPYYITPIIMGVSMLAQQLMSPTSGDPRQARIMLIMPIFFTFLFLNFPSGLVIYWLANNMLSIAQQALINRKEKDGKQAKSRRKKMTENDDLAKSIGKKRKRA